LIPGTGQLLLHYSDGSGFFTHFKLHDMLQWSGWTNGKLGVSIALEKNRRVSPDALTQHIYGRLYGWHST